MTVSRDQFDETKNWTEPEWQEGIPVMDADLNLAMKIGKSNLRRAVCDFIGNGSSNDGFMLSGDIDDPTISAGNIWVAGLKIELPEDMAATAQPNAPVAFPTGNGAWYLDVVEKLLTNADDPDIRDYRLPANVDTPIKVWQTDWTLRKVSGSSLPEPEPDHYHIGLAFENGGVLSDIRNTGLALAGSDTGYHLRPGGRPGGGHGHHDEDIAVSSPKYSAGNLEEVLDEIDFRIETVEGGMGAVTHHAASHGSGGSDPVALSSLPGSLTEQQHGIIGAGNPHPQYQQFPPDADVNMGDKRIINLADPVADNDAVTKQYVDAGVGAGFPGYGASASSVGAANAAGTADTVSRSDHAHLGVHRIRANSYLFHGDIQLVPGSGVALLDNTPNPGDIRISASFAGATAPQPVGDSGSYGASPVGARSDHVHAGVSLIHAASENFIGDVELVEGANVTISKPAPGKIRIDSAPPVTDHGALAGLEDNDHPQYLQTASHNVAAHRAIGVLDVCDVAFIDGSATPASIWHFPRADWSTLVGAIRLPSPAGGIGPHSEWTAMVHLGTGNGFYARPSGPGNWDDAVVIMNEVPQFDMAPFLVSGWLCGADGFAAGIDEYVEYLKIRFYNVSNNRTYPGPPYAIICRFYIAGKKT